MSIRKMLVSIGVIACVGASIGVAASPTFKMLVNGKNFADYKLIGGQMYVSLNKIANQLNASVQFDAKKKTYTVNSKATMIPSPKVIHVSAEPQPTQTPQIIYITPEPKPTPSPQVIYVTPNPKDLPTPKIVYVTPDQKDLPTPKIVYVNQTVYVTPVPSPTVSPSTDTVYPVNTVVYQGPMKLTIKSIALRSNYRQYSFEQPKQVIDFDVEIENTSTDKITWFNYSWKLTLNTKEQIEDSSSSVNGEWMGTIVKKGSILFETTSQLKDISSMSLILNRPYKGFMEYFGEDDKKIDFTLR